MARQNLKQKRGQCCNCPKTKRIVDVLYRGKRLELCEPCRLALSRIIKEREAEAAKPKVTIAAPTPAEEAAIV